MPLDALDELTKLDIGFVKIDVEGHELEALQGMASVLKQNRPVIVFEQSANVISNGTSAVNEYLKSIGYTNLYSLNKYKNWRIPDAVPKIIRAPLRIVEVILCGIPEEKGRLNPIKFIKPRGHSLLFASAVPLKT